MFSSITQSVGSNVCGLQTSYMIKKVLKLGYKGSCDLIGYLIVWYNYDGIILRLLCYIHIIGLQGM